MTGLNTVELQAVVAGTRNMSIQELEDALDKVMERSPSMPYAALADMQKVIDIRKRELN